jgi:hypothetical protein
MLSTHAEELRHALKHKSLRLVSLQWTIARQEARLLWLREGDTPTKFFHIYTNVWGHKKFIRRIVHDGQCLVEEGDKADATYAFFEELLGTAAVRTNSIELGLLDLPRMNLDHLCLGDSCSEDEIWSVIRSLLPNKVPGPDGFTARFLQFAWQIIKGDVMLAFEAFWQHDSRNFHSINEALLTLLSKKEDDETLWDYRPISLIHVMGKLFSKILANRLAPHLNSLIHHGQSAFCRDMISRDYLRIGKPIRDAP